MSTLEASLLQLEFLVLLCQFTGCTPEGGTAVAESSTLDVVPAADISTLHELQNPAHTAAASDEPMNHTIAIATAPTEFGIWGALCVQVFVALFVLCVDDAGTEPRHNTGSRFIAAVKEIVAPFSAGGVHGQVLSVTVSATDGHSHGGLRLLSVYLLLSIHLRLLSVSLRLLRICFLLVLGHFRLYETFGKR